MGLSENVFLKNVILSRVLSGYSFVNKINMESSSLEDDMVSILHALSLAGLDSYAQRLKDFWEETIDRSVLESFDV